MKVEVALRIEGEIKVQVDLEETDDLAEYLGDREPSADLLVEYISDHRRCDEWIDAAMFTKDLDDIEHPWTEIAQSGHRLVS